jgi:hypothetical protein
MQNFWVFFSIQIWENFFLKIVSVQVIPPKAAHIKTIKEGSQNTTVEIVGRLGLLYGTC